MAERERGPSARIQGPDRGDSQRRYVIAITVLGKLPSSHPSRCISGPDLRAWALSVVNSKKGCSKQRRVKSTMLNIHASGASENRRNNSRLFSNLHATATSLSRAQMVQKTFENFGRCSAFVACCIFVFILAMSSSASLSAQTAGTISGHVSDASGASVPDASVSLKNAGTGSERSSVTTGAGDYTFTEVPVAIYSITATHAGFKAATSNNVQVQVQQSVRLDFRLQVGAVTQSIEVEATGALLQSENATLGTVVENEAVNELPLNGRSEEHT